MSRLLDNCYQLRRLGFFFLNGVIVQLDVVSDGISKAALKDKVYEKIRLDIISFELKPGERVSESQLAERFDVGIASIRAVLPKLVQEGLMSSKRRLGHMVAPITMQDVHNTCQLRELLEPSAAELAAPNVDVDLLEEIDERSKAEIAAGDRKGEMKSLMANREFHVAIARATGNEKLSVWVAQLQDYSIRYHYLLRHSSALSDDWSHSHEPILRAFRKRDPAEARREMQQHLSKGRMHLIDAIMRMPGMQEINIGDI